MGRALVDGTTARGTQMYDDTSLSTAVPLDSLFTGWSATIVSDYTQYLDPDLPASMTITVFHMTLMGILSITNDLQTLEKLMSSFVSQMMTRQRRLPCEISV